MPELPDDDIQRMPDADRIRNRIRERREAEQTEQTTSEVKYGAPDQLDPNDPDSWKVEEVKTADFAGVDDPAMKLDRPDNVVDHKANDLAMKLDRPDNVVDHKADDVVDHKADDVDGPITNDPFNFEEIKVTFDDPITGTGIDKASPKGLPVDESAEPSSDSGYYEGTVATGGVSDGDDMTDGIFKFAVPTDAPDEGDSFKSVSGMDEAIIPTGETAMQQQPADPVGDALAPLDGGDQLVDPAADSAGLTAQVDGLHDGGDDGLDDSFGG